MSIIICVINQNKELYLASDLRAIRSGIVTDNYKKVFEIRPSVYFGMTGIAEAGIPIREHLKTMIDHPIEDIIAEADRIFQPNQTRLTISLCGKDSNSGFFSWQKNHQGITKPLDANDRSITYSICTNQNKNLFSNYFRRLLIEGIDIKNAIDRTIQFASDRDRTISSKYDLIKITE